MIKRRADPGVVKDIVLKNSVVSCVLLVIRGQFSGVEHGSNRVHKISVEAFRYRVFLRLVGSAEMLSVLMFVVDGAYGG